MITFKRVLTGTHIFKDGNYAGRIIVPTSAPHRYAIFLEGIYFTHGIPNRQGGMTGISKRLLREAKTFAEEILLGTVRVYDTINDARASITV